MSGRQYVSVAAVVCAVLLSGLPPQCRQASASAADPPHHGFLGRAPSVLRDTNGTRRFADCVEVHEAGHRQSGIYRLHINNRTVLAPCVLTANASYTVVQQRVDATGNFVRYWKDYKYGFGSSSSNYWIGLDQLHSLTQYHDRYLQVNLQDWTLKTYYAYYPQVFVSDESGGYRLTLGGGHYGTAPDDMSHQAGQPFSTLDRPDANGCVRQMHAGWWYNYCAFALLNGRYYTGGYYPQPPTNYWDGIYWKDLYGFNYSMKFASMLVGKTNLVVHE